MTTDKIIYTIILGIIVGILGGWQGQSGSIYILIGLLAFGIVDNEHTAAGTALLYTSVPVSLGATYLYYKQGYINLEATTKDTYRPISILPCVSTPVHKEGRNDD